MRLAGGSVKRVVPSGNPIESSEPCKPFFTSSIFVPALTTPGMSPTAFCASAGGCARKSATDKRKDIDLNVMNDLCAHEESGIAPVGEIRLPKRTNSKCVNFSGCE